MKRKAFHRRADHRCAEGERGRCKGRRAVPAPRDQHGDILTLGGKKYGGMDASEAKRLRELEAENARLKRIVADQVLDMSAMKELLEKTLVGPWRSAKAVGFLMTEKGLPERRACRIVGLARSVQQYQPVAKNDETVVAPDEGAWRRRTGATATCGCTPCSAGRAWC